MANKELTPQQKSKELIEALQFCKEKKLVTAEEIAKAKSKEERFRLACKAKLRMRLYQKLHKEK